MSVPCFRVMRESRDPAVFIAVWPSRESRELHHNRMFRLFQITATTTEATFNTNVMEGMAQFVEYELEDLFQSHLLIVKYLGRFSWPIVLLNRSSGSHPQKRARISLQGYAVEEAILKWQELEFSTMGHATRWAIDAREVLLRARGGAYPYCAKLDHANNTRCIFHHGAAPRKT